MRNETKLVFQKNLLNWFLKSGRDLPWRKTKDPYRIWVSEIMLQQTQVERVKIYYQNFLQKFPNVFALADASWEEVLSVWRGLGYYRRAKNMHHMAKILVEKYDGQFPKDFDQLQELPGIGSYTAAAIMSFAFSSHLPALDTNIKRIFSRAFGPKWSSLPPRKQFEFAKSFILSGKSAAFNHALMDLGATVCTAKNVQCQLCPLQKMCQFSKNVLSNKGENISLQILADRPHKSYKAAKKLIKVAVGVIIYKGKVLISKRKCSVPFGGLWEFPGGKIEAGEDERMCLKREMQEELGIEVAVRPSFYRTVTHYNGQDILLSFHRCSILLGDVQAKEVEEFLWVKPEELFDFQFPPANFEVIKLLQQKKAMFRV